MLADRGQHRAPSIPELLVAALAEISGRTVLALDKDFELIAQIMGQPLGGSDFTVTNRELLLNRDLRPLISSGSLMRSMRTGDAWSSAMAVTSNGRCSRRRAQ